MKYTVRNADGQLEYESFKQLEEAVRMGFVDPEDELLREGETEWKKVSSQPTLLKPRGRRSFLANRLSLWIGVAVACGGAAFWMSWQAQEKPELYALSLVFAFAAVGVLFKVTTDAAKRRR